VGGLVEAALIAADHSHQANVVGASFGTAASFDAICILTQRDCNSSVVYSW